MMYNIMQVNKLHQQELLRAAEQRRLAAIAQLPRQPQSKPTVASSKAILNQMRRELVEALLDEPQIA